MQTTQLRSLGWSLSTTEQLIIKPIAEFLFPESLSYGGWCCKNPFQQFEEEVLHQLAWLSGKNSLKQVVEGVETQTLTIYQLKV